MLTRGPYLNRQKEYERARELRSQNLGYRSIAALLKEEFGKGISWQAIGAWVKDIPIDIKQAHLNAMGQRRGDIDNLTSKDSIRTRLIEERGHKCEECGNGTWLDQPIMLEIHRLALKPYKECTREDLRLLCPNCHSLTDSWRGRNVGNWDMA